ncbi:hypothetical protein QUC31_010648 [Theobroma cacao]
MADPNANVPNHDPFYAPLADNTLTFMNNMEPLLRDGDTTTTYLNTQRRAMNNFMGNRNHPFMDDTRNSFLNNMNPSLSGNSSLNNSNMWHLPVNSQSNPSNNNLGTSSQIQPNFEKEDLNNPHVPTRVDSPIQELSQHLFFRQSREKRKQPIDVIRSKESGQTYTRRKKNSNAGCSGSGTSKNHGEMNNQGETNLVNENVNSQSILRQQDLLPVQEPVLHPTSIPPLSEQEATEPVQTATNWEGTGNESNLENSQAGMHNESNLENSQTASFSFHRETSSQVETSLRTERFDNNKGKLSGRPRGPPPSDCSGCEMLREIIHRKGPFVKKLQLHGELLRGRYFHALINVFDEDTTVVSDVENINFYDKGYKDVEKFLSQYFIKQEQEGWSMHDDPRAVFFKVLCFGSGKGENLFDRNYIENALSVDPDIFL